MRGYIVETALGILALDESKRIVDRELYPKGPEKVAESISALQEGKITQELTYIVRRMGISGYDELVFESDNIASSVGRELKTKVLVETPSVAGLEVRGRLGDLAVEYGFVAKPEEWTAFTSQITLLQAQSKMRAESERPDLMMAQAVNAVDELDKSTNLFVSRVREWYGLHFPEMDYLVKDHELYLKIVAKIQSRDKISEEALKTLGVDQDTAKHLEEISKRSTGGEVAETDLIQLGRLAEDTLTLYSLRKEYENYIETIAKRVSPNLADLLGTMLAARLIALAGGLNRLSRLPASTIQVLGAEKALFRSLKTGSAPPKHGVIFQYEDIHNAPRWQRGKIARALAGKLAIASRMDAFSSKAPSSILKDRLGKRVAEIRQVYANPPERKTRPEREPEGYQRRERLEPRGRGSGPGRQRPRGRQRRRR